MCPSRSRDSLADPGGDHGEADVSLQPQVEISMEQMDVS